MFILLVVWLLPVILTNREDYEKCAECNILYNSYGFDEMGVNNEYARFVYNTFVFIINRISSILSTKSDVENADIVIDKLSGITFNSNKLTTWRDLAINQLTEESIKFIDRNELNVGIIDMIVEFCYIVRFSFGILYYLSLFILVITIYNIAIKLNKHRIDDTSYLMDDITLDD